MTKRKPQSHLINILKSTTAHHPNFVVLLGAGSSKTSGVELASDLISKWRDIHYKMYQKDGEDRNAHFSRFSWFKTSDEYSVLFEKLFDQPSQRREFIESCIADASPSWGYIYLVNLLRKRVFNTVFTTNFDDLLNEACYQFSNDVRPIVCSHDSSIGSIRITSNRAKIIKLHGDFLFDNIKNTMRELETLEQNTQDKFKQYASEFGFIVMGYAGNDRSIMDTFNTLLRFEQYFPHGIYWCVRRGAEISPGVDSLSRFPRFHLVEIDGFDEFFAELSSELEIPLQQEMADPYKTLAGRLNRLIDRISLPQDAKLHPVIEKDIQRLGSSIQRMSPKKSSTQEDLLPIDKVEINGTDENLPIPYGLLSDLSFREEDYDTAFKYRVKELDTDPSPKSFVEIFRLMFLSGRSEECLEEYIDMYFKSEDLVSKQPMSTFDLCLVFLSNKEYDYADKVLEFGRSMAEKSDVRYILTYYYLNKFQIKKHRGLELDQDEVEKVKTFSEEGDIDAKIGAFSLLENAEEAEKLILKIKERGDVGYMVSWPILDFIRLKLKDVELKKQFAAES